MLSTIVLLSVVGLTLAQDTIPTITVPFIGFGNDILYASIVAVAAQATTIEIACDPLSDCGLFPKETVIYGPSTYNIDMSDPNTDFTATADCSFGSPYIVCKETAGGSEANFPGSSTSSYDADHLTSLPVSVTAGAEKLLGGQLSAATGIESSQAAVSTSVVSKIASSAALSMTPIARSGSSGSAIASQTSVAPAMVSTAAATAHSVTYARGPVIAAACVFGTFLL